ncbi:MAG: NADH-quinone oxidoreductase subunit J [Ardenticatenales bacterium]|jgi:NADH-quinone oxidoreductase subunit J|nr:NADH-quinone oxidoreductase subunit J [Ardenticatenales bacterium]
MMEMLAFGLVAGVAVGGAIGVVAARNVFVSALWLVLSFIGVAGIYAILGADFLAATQVLIYVGAISVLILFAVMLTHHVMGDERANNRQAFLAFIVSSSVVAALGVLAYRTDWPVRPADAGGSVVTAMRGDVAGGGAASAAALTGASTTLTSTIDVALNQDSNVVRLGQALMTEHLLSFEIISLVLLVALIGAIVIARD